MTRTPGSNSEISPGNWKILLSCEHATNHIPKKWKSRFRNQTSVLKGHRGWDPGTLELGQQLKKRIGAELIVAETSRLLLEMNRSLGHPRLFSEFTRDLSPEEKQDLIVRYWIPYRSTVSNFVKHASAKHNHVLHVSLHSFTPELNGEIRNADIGVLYDPGRRSEVYVARLWIKKLRRIQPELRIRKNYPYRGTADGLTTGMRKVFPDSKYAGIELEINQAFPNGNHAGWKRLTSSFQQSVQELAEELNQR